MLRRKGAISYIFVMLLIVVGVILFLTGRFEGNKFTEQTYVGEIDIGGLTKDEALVVIRNEYGLLQEKQTNKLRYLENEEDFPTGMVELNIENTLENIKMGGFNRLYVEVKEKDLEKYMGGNLSVINFNEVNKRKVIEKIESELGRGKLTTKIDISNDVKGEDNVVPVVASIELTNKDKNVLKVLDVLNGKEILASDKFSMMNVVNKSKVQGISDEDITYVSSVLYEAVLHTNFTVTKRSTRYELLIGVTPGFEAVINRELGVDFEFFNPNKGNYVIEVYKLSNKVFLQLKGRKTSEEYEPYIELVETYHPKKLKKYGSEENVFNQNYVEGGEYGFEVVVRRNSVKKGKVVGVETVSKDFYLPKEGYRTEDLIKRDKEQKSQLIREKEIAEKLKEDTEVDEKLKEKDTVVTKEENVKGE